MPTADEAFSWAFFRASSEAVSAGLPMRVVLKGGETFDAIPESISRDVSNVRPREFPPDEFEDEFGPAEHVLLIAGNQILAQEVREFTVRLP